MSALRTIAEVSSTAMIEATRRQGTIASHWHTHSASAGSRRPWNDDGSDNDPAV